MFRILREKKYRIIQSALAGYRDKKIKRRFAINKKEKF